jgi:hypothetical protein
MTKTSTPSGTRFPLARRRGVFPSIHPRRFRMTDRTTELDTVLTQLAGLTRRRGRLVWDLSPAADPEVTLGDAPPGEPPPWSLLAPQELVHWASARHHTVGGGSAMLVAELALLRRELAQLTAAILTLGRTR